MINFGGPFSINLVGEIVVIVGLVASSVWSLFPVIFISFFSVAYSLLIFASSHLIKSFYVVFKDQLWFNDIKRTW
jgi:hypothetical protein